MTGTSSTVESSVTSAVPNPSPNIYSSASLDTQTFQITQHKLNWTNFREWFQSVQLVIKGKGKMGYLTGDNPMPSPTDAAKFGT